MNGRIKNLGEVVFKLLLDIDIGTFFSSTEMDNH